ncbi:MAG: DUF3343 domain-containing protein [Bacillota bacterium]
MGNSFCVVTFHSTHLALRYERVARQEGVETCLIPVPRQISSSCGLAGRFGEELLLQVQQLCASYGLETEGFFRVPADRQTPPQPLE